MLSSVPRVSSIAMSVRAAGIAISTRMTTGITVQMISALVLCVMVTSGLAPCDLRNFTSDQIIQPNTNTPIATHHQKMVMCSA